MSKTSSLDGKRKPAGRTNERGQSTRNRADTGGLSATVDCATPGTGPPRISCGWVSVRRRSVPLVAGKVGRYRLPLQVVWGRTDLSRDAHHPHPPAVPAPTPMAVPAPNGRSPPTVTGTPSSRCQPGQRSMPRPTQIRQVRVGARVERRNNAGSSHTPLHHARGPAPSGSTGRVPALSDGQAASRRNQLTLPRREPPDVEHEHVDYTVLDHERRFRSCIWPVVS